MPKEDVCYRGLKDKEKAIMKERGCVSEEWQKIQVVDNFKPERFKNVAFFGNVKLGRMDGRIETTCGINRKCGIYNSTIHNCIIGNNVYIRNVANYISNYKIEDDVVIDGINTLEITEETSFGNGVLVSVINEAGGREVPIYDRLSSHEAYMLAMYRHRTTLQEKLVKLIENYCKLSKAVTGVIGRGSRISNCGIIRNLKVESFAEILGIVRLSNGTIKSSKKCPTTVGAGVIADDFIISDSCIVTDGVIINKCYIGQGSQLGKQYSAENSLFFANCGGFHGEACSIFAGPYTVTHHKSTLLIAGYFSFMNAGSGSNQSNHMYKLGPLHQGILERGTKTTSNSYIVYPAKIGAFTLVMGRHASKSDTSNFPFSYLLEEDGESTLVPGVNIKSVGTIRDSKKWPKRDNRMGSENALLDNITFYLLTPYTVEKMLKGKALLEKLKNEAGIATQKYYHNGFKITRHSLLKGIKYYDLGVRRFIGNVLVSMLQKTNFTSIKEIQQIFEAKKGLGCGNWIDMAGLIVPQKAAEELMKKIELGILTELDDIKYNFKKIHNSYSDYEVSWMKVRLEEQLGKEAKDFTSNDIITVLDDWIEAVEALDNMRHADAQKEYSATAMVGFGLDGSQKEKNNDFAMVRGDEKSDEFILRLKEQLELKKRTVAELKEKLK